MKKKICCILFTLIAVCIIYIGFCDEVKFEVINSNKEIKFVDSKILTEDIVKNDVYEASSEVVEDTLIESVVQVEESKDLVEEKVEVNVDSVDESVEEKEPVVESIPTVSTNEVLTGKMSGYGPDCPGCSGYLAYGMYVGDGTIYYNDSQYGNVRIVAGDKKYKFGTIVKINDSMLAIVLDRGGSIGIGKKFLFDLLYSSEAEASKNGVLSNVTFEILRNGF